MSQINWQFLQLFLLSCDYDPISPKRKHFCTQTNTLAHFGNHLATMQKLNGKTYAVATMQKLNGKTYAYI
eukprot:c25449_g1_i1 orf=138-347(-)